MRDKARQSPADDQTANVNTGSWDSDALLVSVDIGVSEASPLAISRDTGPTVEGVRTEAARTNSAIAGSLANSSYRITVMLNAGTVDLTALPSAGTDEADAISQSRAEEVDGPVFKLQASLTHTGPVSLPEESGLIQSETLVPPVWPANALTIPMLSAPAAKGDPLLSISDTRVASRDKTTEIVGTIHARCTGDIIST